jgi:hypothetical protein
MKFSEQAKVWLKGFISAVISGLSGGVGCLIAEPTTFNFTETGFISLAKVCGVSALIGAANYIKQSPLPSSNCGPPPAMPDPAAAPGTPTK